MIKRIISLFIVISILSVGLSVSADFSGLTNLALNKTVTSAVSRSEYVTDGGNSETANTKTWYSKNAGSNLTIDLGSALSFDTVAVYEYSVQRMTGYKIEGSSDNTSWETLAESTEEAVFTEATGVTKQYLATITFPSSTARYVKFTVKTATGTFYVQEIEVYNSSSSGEVTPPEGGEEPDEPVLEDPQNFARYKSVEVSRATSGKDHTLVTDGNKAISTSNHAWNVKAGDYMIIDLATQKTFDCVVVYEYSHLRTKSYKIEVSTDKSDWETAFESDEILTGYGGITSAESNAPHYFGKFIIDKTTARYVKITINGITESGKTAYIEEIEVFDQTNMPEIEEGSEPIDITLDPPVVVNELPYESENFHIYLFLGQSNMAGRGPLMADDYVVVENAYLLNSDGNWEHAQVYPKDGSKYKTYQGYNRYSNVDEDSKNQTNPALSFARTMRKNLPDTTGLGIISNARGGTTVKQWQKDYDAGVDEDGNKLPNMYEKTISRTKAALEKGGVIKGILWLQGDTDAAYTDYLDNLKILVNDMRTDLGLDENKVPFIASQFVPTKTAQNAAIAKIADYIPNSDYITNEGTDSVGDNLHFDGPSQRLLGCRYAEKIMNKVYGKNMTATELYNSVYLVRPDDLPEAFEVPLSYFPSTAEESDSVTVKNHLGEMQTITGHYMVILSKVHPGNTDYTLEECGVSVSTNGVDFKQNAKSLVELNVNNAYCILLYDLKPSRTYYFRTYSVYKDSSGNLWTVNGEEIVPYETPAN